jgi:hypothetical protein
MIGHGLGPGFFTTVYRRSVIFSVDGLEFLFTFLTELCASAVGTPLPSNPAAHRAIVDFIMPRRLVKRL